MNKILVRRIDKWDIAAASQLDGTWIVDATDIWGESQTTHARDLEQGLLLLAPLIQQDVDDLKALFGLA